MQAPRKGEGGLPYEKVRGTLGDIAEREILVP